MKRIKILLGIFAFSLLVLSLPAVASAQRNGGRYSTNENLKSTVKRLKSDSKDFAKFVDKDLDDSRYNGGHREDSVNQLAKDFRDAASRLDSKYNSRNIDDSQSEANEVLSLGDRMSREMRRLRLSPNVQNYWKNIEGQLSDLSRAYRGGRGGRGGRNN